MLRFQSTFPRGERRTGGSQAVAACNFNPRSLVGNDGLHFHRDWRRFISIHVPSWGTTQCLANTRRMRLFQSTFPRGERLARLGKFGWTALFQSTFPLGERPGDQTGTDGNPDFNPRSLVGNDGKFSQIFFVFLCNKYNFSTFYYPFSLFFSVIHVTFLIFVVRILPAFYVYF